MNHSSKKPFLAGVLSCGFMFLSCSSLLAQPSSPVLAQAQVRKDQSQLPQAPVPVNIPSSPTKSEVALPQSSSSSQSSSSASDATPRIWTGTDPNAHIEVQENTVIRVMTDQPLSSRQASADMPVLFTLNEDVVIDNVLIIPRGATVHGTVVGSKYAGTLTGSPDLILKLVSLDLGGRSYPLFTYQFKVQGTSKTRPTETKMKGGAVIGAIVGGAFSGSAKGQTSAVGKLAGMGTGAALGAGVGTMVSAATPGPVVTLPAESQMDFYLASPISLVPVTAKEAAKLSQGKHQSTPALYVRGDTP